MFGFVDRKDCPSCGSDGANCLKSISFGDMKVRSFIDSFYHGEVPVDSFSDVRYEISLCSSCDLIWQRYILDKTGMQLLYENWVPIDESYMKKSEGDVSLFFQYAKEMNAICHFFSKKPSDLNILDFGMGWGYWCRMAVAFNFDVTGYDLCRQRRRYARKNGIQVVDDPGSFELGTFDFINCEQVLEHLPDPLATLNLLSGLLGPGGVVRLSVPDAGAVPEQLQQPDWTAGKDCIHPFEHVNAYSHDALIAMAGNAGFVWQDEAVPLVSNHSTCLYFRNA